MPAISVIVPAYRPAGFGPLQASMAANADVDAEWIVVDDGSGPDSDAVFATLDGSGARVIRQAQNRRQGAARNAGLAQARGAWIKFLDADDRLDDGHLGALLAAAQAPAAARGALPFAPTWHVFPGGGTSVNDSWRGLPADPMAQYARLLHRPFLHHCGVLFPRALLRDLGGYDESLITDEDGDLLLRVLRAGRVFVPVEGVHYLYVHNGGGGRVSADDNPGKMQARLRVCDKVESGFDAGAMPVAVRAALAQRLDRLAMTYFAADPGASRAALARARALSPGYVPDMRAPLRLLRRLGGPRAVLAATDLYRRLRGRPRGGAQG